MPFDAKTELQVKIREYAHALENFLELYLDPNFCTTCGEVWDAEEKKKAKETELWAFIETLTIYKKENT